MRPFTFYFPHYNRTQIHISCLGLVGVKLWGMMRVATQ